MRQKKWWPRWVKLKVSVRLKPVREVHKSRLKLQENVSKKSVQLVHSSLVAEWPSTLHKKWAQVVWQLGAVVKEARHQSHVLLALWYYKSVDHLHYAWSLARVLSSWDALQSKVRKWSLFPSWWQPLDLLLAAKLKSSPKVMPQLPQSWLRQMTTVTLQQKKTMDLLKDMQ